MKTSRAPRPVELLARLKTLDAAIDAQAMRVNYARQRGWSTQSGEQLLRNLAAARIACLYALQMAEKKMPPPPPAIRGRDPGRTA